MKRVIAALLCLLFCNLVFGQDKKPAPPDSVTITALEAKPFLDKKQAADVTQLQIRALSAEIQLAQKNLAELRTKGDKEQGDLQSVLLALLEKHGIPRDKLSDYDLQDKDGGFVVSKRVAQKE
jgi:hypothetical protein